ncbi:class I SAM-dependent methyltransferase [Rubrivivax sp. RP6-9]|uniref:class I SAM-dependent methyltransferase n=1 Tax=Rubrivivax sp. RP6-9 TaxID=3415750 RepID=UPI003CC568E7
MAAPSDWLLRWAPLIRPGGTVLDVACGGGRHLRWLAAQGFRVTGVDRNAAALAELAGVAETVLADLESAPWPEALAGRRFDAVLVTNYLWRPLVPRLLAAVADDGLYIHETFADGQQHLGKPSRADFLLQPGELLALTAGLRTVAFEDGLLDAPLRRVQRIVAAGAQAPAAKIGDFTLAPPRAASA